MNRYVGELAALATAFLWMLSALCWTVAGERIGSLAVNVVRLVIAGLACFLLLVLALRRQAQVAAALVQPRVTAILLLGAVAGPVLGVTTMMIAVRRIPTGLAQTFLSLSPVLIIPFMRLIYRERVGAQAVAGALLASLGVALLFIGK